MSNTESNRDVNKRICCWTKLQACWLLLRLMRCHVKTPGAWNTDPNKYRLVKVFRDHIKHLLHALDAGEVVVGCNAHRAAPSSLLPRLTKPTLAVGAQLDKYTIKTGTCHCGGCGYCGLRDTLGATGPRGIGAPFLGTASMWDLKPSSQINLLSFPDSC